MTRARGRKSFQRDAMAERAWMEFIQYCDMLSHKLFPSPWMGEG